ncbi:MULTISPECIES: methionyl-tRNA formyltransferase [unclassified Leifsonia]|uniref:methionyl-tRNA formyltransferase n=1 Tax=unclassified Leifsonia TaxID=2663824 RepID=UPI0006FB4C41|nr:MULTISPECIES: methionyl-tRNA formyltransferase [unclassified Leifsonia]KQX06809.1 methionyl-tRNA formyltransferase [Leifsonia sp. Root1293]KRA11094.1 methionyl-tRNA formyltransferase [Leifsonia sp. Root60]
MKILFAGTPEVAVPSLRALHAAGHTIAAVVTRADAPVGRKRVLTESPVAAVTGELGLPVVKANRLDEAVTEQLLALGAELGVVVAYGGLVREPLLSTPRLGWVNLHFSLLPRWRGAAPVQRAIAAGDTVTGADVFQLVPALDAGDLFGRIERPIAADDTAGTMLAALSVDGAELLVDVVAGLEAGTAVAVPQTGEVTLAPKLTIDDARIDWALPLARIDSSIRGMTPEPGAFTEIDGARFKVLEARPAPDAAPLPPGAIRSVDGRVLAGTADAPLELRRVQPAGKTPMAAADWWRGAGTDEVIAG